MNKSEIIEKISLAEEVAFLGVGAGGGNIISEFEKFGYNCLSVNTSMEDLSSIGNVKHYHHIRGGQGAFKDRDKAKELAKKSFPEIMTVITEQLEQQFIVVVFSMAGGTGSGLGPLLCDVLVHEYGKTVICVGILPDETGKESIVACNNAVQCFAEIEQIEGLGNVYFLDNKRKQNIFDINREFAIAFDAYLKTVNTSKQGNFDVSEKKFMLSQSGYAVLTRIKDDKASALSIVNAFRENVYAPIENDKIVRYIGASLPTTNIDIRTLFNEIGEPIDNYSGYGSQSCIVIATGMSYPATRIAEIEERVTNNIQNVQKNMSANKELLFANKKNPLAEVLEGVVSSRKSAQTWSSPVEMKLESRDLLKKYF